MVLSKHHMLARSRQRSSGRGAQLRRSARLDTGDRRPTKSQVRLPKSAGGVEGVGGGGLCNIKLFAFNFRDDESNDDVGIPIERDATNPPTTRTRTRRSSSETRSSA